MPPRLRRLLVELFRSAAVVCLGIGLLLANPYLMFWFAWPIIFLGVGMAALAVVRFAVPDNPAQPGVLAALLVALAVILWRQFKRR